MLRDQDVEPMARALWAVIFAGKDGRPFESMSDSTRHHLMGVAVQVLGKLAEQLDDRGEFHEGPPPMTLNGHGSRRGGRS